MKAVIGEYGKIMILAVVFGSMVLFLFGKGDHDFLGIISKARPEAAVGNADTFAIAHSVFSRKAPELTVTVKKLQTGREYNIQDSGVFEIKAVNQEGGQVPVTVVRITDPVQQDITDETDPQRFVPTLNGEYRVVYRAEETSQGSTKAREKEYRVLAD